MALQNRSAQEIAHYITTELDPDATLTRNDDPAVMWHVINKLCLNEWCRPGGIEITVDDLAEYIGCLPE